MHRTLAGLLTATTKCCSWGIELHMFCSATSKGNYSLTLHLPHNLVTFLLLFLSISCFLLRVLIWTGRFTPKWICACWESVKSTVPSREKMRRLSAVHYVDCGRAGSALRFFFFISSCQKEKPPSNDCFFGQNKTPNIVRGLELWCIKNWWSLSCWFCTLSYRPSCRLVSGWFLGCSHVSATEGT